jgi:peptide/nickel transport system substrate-binding protein
MQRRLWSGLVAAAAVALGAAGVAGNAQASTDGGTVTLSVGVTQDIDSPNVTVGYTVAVYELWNLQYATLTDKAAADFSTIPGLAESWEASDDGLTYTYTLREGLLWSDGQPLTAADVEFTVNTSRDQEWFNHSSVTANLTATVIDDRTIEITSAVPDPKLPNMDVYILPKHIWEGPAADDITAYDALEGVGSGPFTLKEWKPGQEWTMVANPNDWKGQAAIDQIVFRFFSDGAAMVSALESGELDVANDIPAELFGGLDGTDGIVTVAGAQGGFTELAMNGMAGGIGDGHPALLDIDVRHAVAHAIDREALFERVALGIGLPLTVLGVSPLQEWLPEIPADQQLGYDPAKANELLDAGGYLDTDGDGVREMPDGSQSLTFRYAERSEGTQGAAVRELITGWLAEVGIKTEVSVYDDTQLGSVVAEGTYDLFVWGWTPFVDPDPMLSYFTCDQVTYDVESVGYNDANWCSEEYDALYAQQNQELDRAKRIELVHEMVTLFHNEATYVVLYHDADTQAYRTDRFEGWLQQPEGTGPVIFSNSSPTYFNLSLIGSGGSDGSGSDDGGDEGSSVGLIIGIVAAVVVLAGVGLLIAKRGRSGRDDRE